MTVQDLFSHATFHCDHKKNSRAGRVMRFIIFTQPNKTSLDAEPWIKSQSLLSHVDVRVSDETISQALVPQTVEQQTF